MPEPTFRDAREEDLDLLLPMMEAFYRGEGIAWEADLMRGAAARLLSDPSLGRVVVSEQDGDTAGYAVLSWGYDIEFGGRDAFLTEIYLRPPHRRRGTGRRLLERIEELARYSGAGAIHLEVRPHNEAALALYREAGFATTGRTFLSKRLKRLRSPAGIPPTR